MDANHGDERSVTVLGAGSVGATLARAWARAGRAITFGQHRGRRLALRILTDRD